jgi:hypothetical protein
VITVSHNKEWQAYATRMLTLESGTLHETGGES